MSSSLNAVLLLEDGTVYLGKSYGKPGLAYGEICFNTGMTGYQEIFTDPSYFGQLMVTTNAHIGNYGVRNEEVESEKIQISGLICKNFSFDFSRQRANNDVKEYFNNQDVIVISDIDTRSLVRHIRDKGAMNAVIACEQEDNLESLKTQLKKIPRMEGLELASKVSTEQSYEMGDPQAEFKIAVLDCGTKKNILRCFSERGAFLKVFPAKTPYQVVADWNPDGIFISNGPGDPASMDYAIAFVQSSLADNKPTFGICLGHQILALAMGIPTYKMHHGHRGINHPVKNLTNNSCEITSQNHGFGVHPEELKAKSDIVEVTHVNLNDHTVEGMRHKTKPAFSVQYHPESSPGPHDSRYLFDEFISMIKKYKI